MEIGLITVNPIFIMIETQISNIIPVTGIIVISLYERDSLYSGIDLRYPTSIHSIMSNYLVEFFPCKRRLFKYVNVFEQIKMSK